MAGCVHQHRGAELGRLRQRLSVRLLESVAQHLCAPTYVTIPEGRDDEEGDAAPKQRGEDRALEDEDDDEPEAP